MINLYPRPGGVAASLYFLLASLLLLPQLARAGTPVLRLEGTVAPGTGVDATAFVDGLELVNVATGLPVALPVPNGSFETFGALGNGSYGYNPSGATWAFASFSGIASNGSPFGAAPAPDGRSVAFLQTTSTATGYFSQTLPSLPAGLYQLRLRAAQRSTSTTPQSVRVLADGVVVGTFTPGAAFATYLSASFAVDAPVLRLEATQPAAAGRDVTAFVDALEIVNVATGAAVANAVPNASFESFSSLSNGNYGYTPAGASWSFVSMSGIAGNGSAFGAPSVPDGSYAAFLQTTASGAGYFSQTLAGLAAGTYQVRLRAAQRSSGTADQSVRVLLNGTVVGTFAPVVGSFTTYLSSTFSIGPPLLSSVTPAVALPGAVLTLNGIGLQGTSSIAFSGAAGPKVVSSGFVVNADGTQITGVVVTAGAQTGPLTVTTPRGPNQLLGGGHFTRATPLAAGNNHSAQVRANGTLWTWGRNINGQLGLGTTTQQNSPVQVGSATSWVSVAATLYTAITAAVQTDGTLWVWGNNTNGQHGDGSINTTRLVPGQVGAATTWASVSPARGGGFMIGVQTNGTLWGWGNNGSSQLGDGTTTDRLTPGPIGTSANWVSAAAANGYTAAVQTDGTLWAWGQNGYGQLGDGTTTGRSTPTRIGTGTSWVSVSVGESHTLALRADGTLWSWGLNANGQLGDGTTTNRATPTQVGTDTNWLSVEAGVYYTLALKTDGSLWAWGQNNNGQLGDGTLVDKASPVQISPATGWTRIAAGINHSLAEQNCRAGWAWGLNTYGQVGDGSTTNRPAPVLVYGPTQITSFSPAVARPGTSVTVTGLNLSSLTALTVNGADALASVTGATDTGFTFVVPAGAATTGTIVATSGCGSGTSGTFTLLTVTSAAPAAAPAGTSVTLSGTGLNAVTALSVNGVAVTLASATATSLSFVVPAGAGATQSIVLTASGGVILTYTGFVAQLNVTGTSPAANAAAAPVANSATALTFTEPVTAASAAGVAVFGSLAGGKKAGSVTVSGSTASFAATAGTTVTDFKPGEVVSVTVPNTVQGAGGLAATPTVFQFTAGGVASSAGSFGNRLDVVLGSNRSPRHVRWVDMDSDGKPDLLHSNQGTSSFSLTRNTSSLGSLSFAAPTYVGITASTQPYAAAAGDADGDGRPDVATANWQTATVSVRLNASTGPGNLSFGAVADFAVGGLNPAEVQWADFDGDGRQDIVVVNQNGNSISVLRNTSTGVGNVGFAAHATFALSAGANGSGNLRAADLDGDGRLDLVLNNASSTVLRVMRNLSTPGSLSFVALADVPVQGGSTPYGPSLADMDGDGKPDILAVGFNQNNAYVLRNTSTPGSVSFAPWVSFATGTQPLFITAADLNGDGKPDLATANNSTLNVRLNTSTGPGNVSFGTLASYALPGAGNSGIMAADADGDNRLDLVVGLATAYTASVFLNTPPAPAITSFAPTSGPVGTSLTLTGTNLGGTTAITFSGSSGNVVTTGYTINAAGTQITGIVVPAGAQTGTLTVTAPGGTSPASSQTFSILPGISSLTPPDGPVGRVITLSGTNLGGATSVSFNGTAASFTQVSGTTITAPVPAGASSGPVSVTTPLGTASSTSFTVLPAAGALSFDGSDDYVSVPYNLNPLPLTLEAWVRPTAVSGRYAIISNDNPTQYGAGFAINGGQLEIDMHNQFLSVPTATFTANTWVHVAVVFEADGRIRAYLNGVERYNAIPNTTWTSSRNGTSFFNLGRYNASAIFPFSGAIDEVRVWSRALTSCEIADHRSCELAGTEPGLAVYLNFNNAAAGVGGTNTGLTTLADLAAPATDGTLNGFNLTPASTLSNWSAQAGTVSGSCTPFVDAPPTALAQNATLGLDANGSISAATLIAAINNGSSDACGPVTLSVSPTSLSCANLGASLVTLSVTDVAGNVSTATATVTVSVPTGPLATWTGASSTAWTDCANWQYGLRPDGLTDALLPAGMPRYPSLGSGGFALASLTIENGALLSTSTGTVLYVGGNWTNNGTVSLGGPVEFSGAAASQTIGGSGVGNFGTLRINKSGGTVQLARDVTVTSALTFGGGLLETGSYQVTLTNAATITETAASYLRGTVEATRTLNVAGSGSDFGGIGLALMPAVGSTALPGSTRARRTTGTPATGVGGSQGIGRYFDIVPTVNGNLDLTLSLSYRDDELNGIAENRLLLFKSETGASGPWARVDYASYDATANTVTRDHIGSLSVWTLGNADNPLPVELLAFTAVKQGSNVALAWRTASEKNSDRFEVERSRDGHRFERIGEEPAQGTKASPTAYTFLDTPTLLPSYPHALYYRLRQVDLDGTASYSPVRAVQLTPSPLHHFTVYPNPARAAVTVAGLRSGEAVEVLDALGRPVARATAAAADGTARLTLPAGLAAGVYVVHSGQHRQRLTVAE